MIKNEKGLSLLEVIIAIALIGIIAVSVCYALTIASRALFIADERATAESLARSQMEYIKDSDYIDYSVSVHEYYGELTLDGYSINIAVDPLTEGLQKITVYIYHPEDNADPLLTLEGYKRRP